MSSSFKTVAAFVGGLMLGAAALSMSSPEERQSDNPFAPGEGEPVGVQSPEMGLLPADGAAGPLPPPGTPHLSPDGAGTELPPGMVPVEAAPAEVPPAGVPSVGGGTRPVAGVLLLDEHLTQAEARWWQIRGRVLPGVPGAQTLLEEIDALVMLIPDSPGGMPPLQDAVRFLVQERLLLDKLDAAGVDVTEASGALDRLLEPPRGKIEDGQDKAAVPGGAGQAPDGTRPLDPDAPRRALEPG